MEANAVIHTPSRPATIPPGWHKGLAVRLSVTERCQLRCTYCMPEKGCGCVRENARELSHERLQGILKAIHASHGIRRLRFTGGEPLLRADLAELVAGARALGIEDLSLTTNAQLLAGRARELRNAGIVRVNVSLDSVDADCFQRITRGGRLERTLEGIEAAQREGMGPVKLNMVVLRGSNDTQVGQVLRYAMETGNVLRFLELMPIGAGGEDFKPQFVSSAEVRELLAAEGFELTPLPWDGHETSRDWRVKAPSGAVTTCGFISPTSQPFCDGCRRMRITSDGWVYGCLARNVRHDLGPILAEGGAEQARQAAAEILTRAFGSKEGEKYVRAIPSMSMIGG